MKTLYNPKIQISNFKTLLHTDDFFFFLILKKVNYLI